MMRALILACALACAALASPHPVAAQVVPVPACGANSVPAGGVCQGNTIPTQSCAIGALYLLTIGPGTLYSCTAKDTWTALGGGAQVYPLVSNQSVNAVNTVQNTWTTVATPALTLGTGGPNGWFVRVDFSVFWDTSNNTNVLCITGASAGTGPAGDLSGAATPAAPCDTSLAIPTNPLAGSLGAGTTAPFISARKITTAYSATYASGVGAITFPCQANTNNAGGTVRGFCRAVAVPI